MKKMRNVWLLAALALVPVLAASAQESKPETAEGYVFTDAKTIPTTPVKDQSRSGTCWCFSTLSYLESEILKAGGSEIHLSEMWVVRHMIREKAVKYIRMHGEITFAEGGLAHDVTYAIARYGIVPHEVYTGFNYGTPKPDFHELSHVLHTYLDAVLEAHNKSGKPLSTAWLRGFDALLDSYFGELPENFVWNGRSYTPASFRDSLPIRMEDYVSLTSYTHHPFYESFVLEIPDNWLWAATWNLPLDELMQTIDGALDAGYTVAWGTDVSDKGFERRKGIGIVPEQTVEGLEGTEAERWGKLSDAEKEKALYAFDKPVRERKVTQQMRQESFDNFDTTDDHGMLIMGTATDQEGNPFYKVQNSWDVHVGYEGYYYFSKPYVALRTTSVMVNKKALPADLRKKLGLK